MTTSTQSHDLVATDVEVPVDHPSFAGHFPGRPLLPGVVLLSEVIEAVRASTALSEWLGPAPTIANAKFLSPVEPGEQLRLELRPVAGSRPLVDFAIRCGDRPVAKGRLSGTPVSRNIGPDHP